MLAETVTVVMENPTDWTGPAVGILGVVLGALMGLQGLRWQHDAQRAYDVRKLCAAFIHDGEIIRDSYLTNADGLLVSDVAPLLRSLRAKSDEMTRTQRQLELIAHRKVDVAAHRYWLASDHYVDVADHHFKLRAKPNREGLTDANLTWITARDCLIQELKPRPSGTERAVSRIRSWINQIQATTMVRKFLKGTLK